MPVYNTSRYIERCLDSIVGQDYPNWEVIMVDDCSTDNTVEIINNYIKKDDRFKLYHNETNQGCGLTRRKAISYGTGDWFVFIDSDDYVEKDYLSTLLLACVRTCSEVSICGVFNHNSNYEYMSQHMCEKEYITSKEDLYRQYLFSSWIQPYNANKMFSRRVINSALYADLRYCEDSMTLYKWLWEANQAVVIPKSLYHYVRHEDSNSNKNNEPLVKALDTCTCVYDAINFCRRQGFDDILPRLADFIKPHIITSIRELEDDDPRLEKILRMRTDIFS